jgi:hypothetical protein
VGGLGEPRLSYCVGCGAAEIVRGPELQRFIGVGQRIGMRDARSAEASDGAAAVLVVTLGVRACAIGDQRSCAGERPAWVLRTMGWHDANTQTPMGLRRKAGFVLDSQVSAVKWGRLLHWRSGKHWTG